MGEPELMPEPPVLPVDDETGFTRPPVSPSSLQVPGLFLLLVGFIGTIVNGYTSINALADPEATQARIDNMAKEIAKLTNQQIPAARIDDPGTKAMFVAVGVISIIPILGAVAMLRVRFWGLAIFGSIIAMINFANCCCLIGMPVGVYCLIKLLDPDVRSLFARSL